MTDCIFCKIARKEIPSQILYEDDDVFCFLDIKPVTKGHALIIPKEHYDDFSVMNPDITPAIVTQAQRIGEACKKAFNATAYNVGVNNGKDAGQEVFHVHFHLIPRYPDDELDSWGRHATEGKNLDVTSEEIKKFL